MLLSEIARRKTYVHPIVKIELGDEETEDSIDVEIELKISVEPGETEAGRLRVGGTIDEVEEDVIFKSFTFNNKHYKKGGYFPTELVDNIVFPTSYKDERVVNQMASQHLSTTQLEQLLNDFLIYLGENSKFEMPTNDVGYAY